MPIVQCPTCETRLRVAETAATRALRCPKCKETIRPQTTRAASSDAITTAPSSDDTRRRRSREDEQEGSVRRRPRHTDEEEEPRDQPPPRVRDENAEEDDDRPRRVRDDDPEEDDDRPRHVPKARKVKKAPIYGLVPLCIFGPAAVIVGVGAFYVPYFVAGTIGLGSFLLFYGMRRISKLCRGEFDQARVFDTFSLGFLTGAHWGRAWENPRRIMCWFILETVGIGLIAVTGAVIGIGERDARHWGSPAPPAGAFQDASIREILANLQSKHHLRIRNAADELARRTPNEQRREVLAVLKPLLDESDWTVSMRCCLRCLGRAGRRQRLVRKAAQGQHHAPGQSR